MLLEDMYLRKQQENMRFKKGDIVTGVGGSFKEELKGQPFEFIEYMDDGWYNCRLKRLGESISCLSIGETLWYWKGRHVLTEVTI